MSHGQTCTGGATGLEVDVDAPPDGTGGIVSGDEGAVGASVALGVAAGCCVVAARSKIVTACRKRKRAAWIYCCAMTTSYLLRAFLSETKATSRS